MPECVVYWLHDDSCVCPWRHGYIGISARWEKRVKEHRWSKRWPDNFQVTILFRGSEAECFNLEMKLRPGHRIGWNPARGGNNNGRTLGYKHSDQSRANVSASLRGKKKSDEHRRKLAIAGTGKTRSATSRVKQGAAMKGRTKSEETRKRMSEAASLRYANPAEREKMSVAVRRNRPDIRGERNPMYGRVQSEATRRKISKANRAYKHKPWSAARRAAWLQNKEK
jgi:hypothetical protein